MGAAAVRLRLPWLLREEPGEWAGDGARRRVGFRHVDLSLVDNHLVRFHVFGLSHHRGSTGAGLVSRLPVDAGAGLQLEPVRDQRIRPRERHRIPARAASDAIDACRGVQRSRIRLQRHHAGPYAPLQSGARRRVDAVGRVWAAPGAEWPRACRSACGGWRLRLDVACGTPAGHRLHRLFVRCPRRRLALD